jgi:hypothetical protein
MALRVDVRDVFEEAMVRTEYPRLGDFSDPFERRRFRLVAGCSCRRLFAVGPQGASDTPEGILTSVSI